MRRTALKRIAAVVAGILLAIPVYLAAQEDAEHNTNRVRHYRVTDLGTPPGWTFSQAAVISDSGVITGLAAPSATSPQSAAVWVHGQIQTLPTLGGVNSAAFGATNNGYVVVGVAESADVDPNDENFCGYGTHEKCLPVLWHGDTPIPLPTLGGNNGGAGPINLRGEIAGTVETDIRDPDCPGTVAVNGTGPYVFDFKGVIWGPKPGQMRTLEPLPGDTVSIALWINDKGEAVGISGTCANTVVPPVAVGPHSVLWDTSGMPHDLGNLGSTAANAALYVNNHGMVVGASSPTDQSSAFNGSLAFLWTREKRMQPLAPLPGDVASGATAINDTGEIAGISADPNGNTNVVIWQNGSPAKLSDTVIGDSPFDALLYTTGINDAGDIVGFGLTTSGDIHGFVATPLDDVGEQ